MSKYETGDVILQEFEQLFSDRNTGQVIEKVRTRNFGSIEVVTSETYYIKWYNSVNKITSNSYHRISTIDTASSIRLASKAELVLFGEEFEV